MNFIPDWESEIVNQPNKSNLIVALFKIKGTILKWKKIHK